MDYDTQALAPHSVEAEEAVLGSVLVNPGWMVELVSIVRPEDFFIVRHRWVWEAMATLHERREPIDYLTVTHELESMGRLADIGGAAWLLGLVNKTPSSLNADGYAAIVERHAVRRRLLEAASEVARLAHSEETDIEEVTARAEQAVFGATARVVGERAVDNHTLMGDHFDRTADLMRRRKDDPDAVAGVPTGLIDLDRLLGGLKRGSVTIVAGRPGMGKSVLAENIWRHAAAQGVPGLFLSMEMGPDELASRQIAAHAGLDLERVLDARLSEVEYRRYTQAVGELAALPLASDFEASLNVRLVRAKIQRAVHEYGVGLVVLDYVQLMREPTFKSDNRVNELSYISRELKVIARDLDVAMVEVAQLSRAVEQRSDKRPLLSDLRESGSLEQDADVAMFLYRDSYYDEDTPDGNVTEILVRKNRHGPTGMVKVMFQGEHARFVNAVRREVEL